MKILLIISSLLAVAVAQEPSISCRYFDGFESYGCDLDIHNPNGLNNFTEIGGIHLSGFTNDDVDVLYINVGQSANVPSIICESFPNLMSVSLYNMGLTAIDDNSFAGCSGVTSLNLAQNRISSISANAFVNLPDLQSLYLDSNSLSTLPENVFASQGALTNLDLNFNFLSNIPAGLFQPLVNLSALFLGYNSLNTINSQWFSNNGRLDFLYLVGNTLTISVDSFTGLTNLQTLLMSYNNINDIPAGSFATMPNLHNLFLNGNSFVELRAGMFTGLNNLLILDISDNPSLSIVQDGAFEGLSNLDELGISNCRLRQLSPNLFEHLPNMTFLSLNFNEIEELPPGLFEPTPHLSYIGLWYNRLKVVRRNVFGSLEHLNSLGLDGNIVNAFDREVIDDAVALNTLYFSGNLCANNYFGNFAFSRNEYLPMLARCFENMRFIIDTTTEGGQDYVFFDGPQPGIVFRVNSDSEVQIALTPFNFVWNPSVEIFIGSANNTLSHIRINEETVVATVPTPNVLRQGQWSDFRVTWANQIVLVFRDSDPFPMLAYTMERFVPINFYGLRATESTATWSVQPFDL